ncbi:allantoinase AllB [Roseibacterium sp. SDUM158016]|uniref:allantoinase AllB n=1 Tax=Roseicyclus sediminis TaxID=2980997 RepID=UPI0021D33454|nr:allantoinase AllB [Roseibacterium sp. SDUM158016]MCU4651806.1 allantoinase AllB [Roseibacterium sp. SDUM158016]
MGLDLLLKNARVVTETRVFEAAVGVADGRIAYIGAGPEYPRAQRIIDLEGRHLLPGCIDVHVHFREPGMTQKEDFGTGTAAAAAGGVTCAFDMPNTLPPTDSAARLAEKRAMAEEKALIDFGLYGLLGEHNLAELPAMAEAGMIGTKLFLGNTTGDNPCPSDGAVLEGFEILAALGLRCSIHAENSPILFWRQNRLKAAGRNDPLSHLAARTDVVAIEALNRAATLADWTGARIHIVHESCAGSVPFIRFWKDRGVDITVETLPQYLYLDAESMSAPGGHLLRMNPPIRQKAHQDPLWAALLDGTIDFVATDHAPHTVQEKEGATIWDMACGFPGVQTSLPLMLEAVSAGRMGLRDVVRIMAGAPSRAFGLSDRKGAIGVGMDADLVVVDMGKTGTLGAESLLSRGKISVYEGREVRGMPVMTFLRGHLVAQDGAIVDEAPRGRMLRPNMPLPAPRNTATTMQAVLRPGNVPWD